MSDKAAQPFFNFSLFARIVALTKPYKQLFYTSIAISLLLAAVAPFRPWLLNYTIDHYFEKYNFPAILQMVALMFFMLLLETILRYFFSYITARIGANIISELRVRVYGHIIYSRLSYFDKTPIGISVTRTISDVEAVNDTFSEGLITILSDVLTILAVSAVMFALSWKLTLLSLVGLPVLLWVTRWFQTGVKKTYEWERTEIGRLNAFLQEHISGMRIIQLFNVEKKEAQKFDAINQKLRDATIKGIWYYSFFFPAVEISVAIGIGFMIWGASSEVLHHQLSIGIISAFIYYINMLFRPLRFIADKINTIQRGLVASERVFKLLDDNQQIADNGTLTPAKLHGKIDFQQVNFEYVKDVPVLKNVSFSVRPGETLALVGATGSGKTSIISLLGRFYEVNSGQILIDDQPIDNYKLRSLRQNMSIVLQDVFLFAGSVYENITLRNPDISREAVIAASKALGAHDFISKLPGGYDFEVMERGATLSMGQRQLISFVRALVYDPQILILDEATSSIDSESEAIIQQAIATLVKGRTSVIIAHRLSTIRNADSILVLAKGEVKEAGTHAALLQQEGLYHTLYQMQFAAQKSEA